MTKYMIGDPNGSIIHGRRFDTLEEAMAEAEEWVGENAYPVETCGGQSYLIYANEEEEKADFYGYGAIIVSPVEAQK